MSRYAKKLFYKIGEVCEICGVEAHVLRYWESEFPMLSPTRNKSGQRIYRQKDLEIIDTIKRLLYQDGFTIAGASRQLLDQGVGDGDFPLLKKHKVNTAEALAEIRVGLQEILELLDRGRAGPSRQAPPAVEKSALPPGTQLVMPEVLLRQPIRESDPAEPGDKPDLKMARR